MKKERLLFRLMIYLAGIFMVSLGIVLCKKSELGISPISSVPYVLEYIVPVSFGTLTMFFHLANRQQKRDSNITLFVFDTNGTAPGRIGTYIFLHLTAAGGELVKPLISPALLIFC